MASARTTPAHCTRFGRSSTDAPSFGRLAARGGFTVVARSAIQEAVIGLDLGPNDTSVRVWQAVGALRQTPAAAARALGEMAAHAHPGAEFYFGMCLWGAVGVEREAGKAIEHLKSAAPWNVPRPKTCGTGRPPMSPKRSMQAVRLTKKSLTQHHTKLIKPDSRHLYIWV
jgi:TPR repeat protein